MRHFEKAMTQTPFSTVRPKAPEAPSARITRPNLAPKRAPFEIEPRGAALRRQAMSKASI
jgi:hypothetical protein